MIARDQLRWNGWGRVGHSMHFTPARQQALLAALGERLGASLEPTPEPVSLEEVTLPAPRLESAVLEGLRASCGADGVRTSTLERIHHAAGRSLPDLLRLRRGEIPNAADVVVYPPDEGAVAAVLRLARESQLAVVPFGGGSSVVGGVDPRLGEGQRGVICLDTTHLDRLVRIDESSHTATFQAGIDGPGLEAALSERGFTLGHFPQSFEHSTLGGWIATRSTGQFSNGYGGIERLLVALRVVTPDGVLRTLEVPRSAAGPDLNGLVLGSEGTLGVIVEATLRVRPAAHHQDARGMMFRSFASGAAAVRAATRAGLPLAMLRLADEEETDVSLLLGHDATRPLDPTLKFLETAERLGYEPGRRCVLIYAAEAASRLRVRGAMSGMRRLGLRHGGFPLGRSPGRSWRRERFRTPYLRDWLLGYGVAVDTLETSFAWSRVESSHDAILRRLRGSLGTHAGSGIAMAHLSHSYVDGACLYFTVIYPMDPALALKQWGAIKREATEAVLAEGGTLSHHHGVGIDHAPWLAREKGSVGLDALRAAKQAVDPQGTMNPGKMW